jgi:hypothetical protein
MCSAVAQRVTPTDSGTGVPLHDRGAMGARNGTHPAVTGDFRRFLALSRVERRLLLNATLVLALVRLALWTVPTRSLLRFVLGHPILSTVQPLAAPRSVGRAVERAARIVPRATCLPRALAALLLLARHGHHAVLRVGVKRGSQGELLAHAWVDCAGSTVIGGAGAKQYTLLPDLDDALGFRFR